jgi:hypothetical protein
MNLNGEPDPEERFELAVAALADRDLAHAREQLRYLYETYPDEAIGRRAALVLAAAELDPRNSDRQLRAGADVAARLLVQPASPEWMTPVAETLYLVALELGAAEDQIRLAQAQRDSLKNLPQLPGPSFVAQLDKVSTERDSLRHRVRGLEQTLAAKEKQLKEREQELERIRKTLKG